MEDNKSLKITSFQNPTIKFLKSLEKPKERNASGLFVFEGWKELELATKAGYEIDCIYFSDDLLSNIEIASIPFKKTNLSKEVFNSLVYRQDISNVIVVAKQKRNELDHFTLPENAFILVLENIEKPGNIGAMLRTADASAVDMVILANGKTDIYNPNVIRSSVGCVFTSQIFSATSEEVKAFLEKNKVAVYTTYLHTETNYYDADFTQKTALILGSEDKGVSETWLSDNCQKIKIPMKGKIDSMNVSNAAAILMYEVVRQRG